jgi:hypothetical protein
MDKPNKNLTDSDKKMYKRLDSMQKKAQKNYSELGTETHIHLHLTKQFLETLFKGKSVEEVWNAFDGEPVFREMFLKLSNLFFNVKELERMRRNATEILVFPRTSRNQSNRTPRKRKVGDD